MKTQRILTFFGALFCSLVISIALIKLLGTSDWNAGFIGGITFTLLILFARVDELK